MNTTETKELHFQGSEMRTRLRQTVKDADTERARGLDGLARLRTARTAAQQREAARLAEKLGPDHPRVAALQARVAAEPLLTAQIRAEAARASTPPLSVFGTGWAVHGHVRGVDGAPLPGITAALYDANGRRADAYGWGCTDAQGYFLARTEQVLDVPPDVFLHLVDARGNHVYVHPTPLAPRGGQAIYLPITLGGGSGLAKTTVCPPPPDDAGGAAGGGTTTLLPPREGPAGETGLGGDPATTRGADEWVVQGTVTRLDNAPMAGVTVSLYDRDLLFDDRLGDTTTDDEGRYRLVYRTGDFRDFIESRPDLYVRVLDAAGAELHTQPAKIRAEAGRTETLDVRVGGGSSRAARKRGK